MMLELQGVALLRCMESLENIITEPGPPSTPHHRPYPRHFRIKAIIGGRNQNVYPPLIYKKGWLLEVRRPFLFACLGFLEEFGVSWVHRSRASHGRAGVEPLTFLGSYAGHRMVHKPHVLGSLALKSQCWDAETLNCVEADCCLLFMWSCFGC